MTESASPQGFQNVIKEMMANNRVLLKGNYGDTLRPFSFKKEILGNQAETLISLKEQYKSATGNNSRKKITKQILDCIQAIEEWAEPLPIQTQTN